MTIRVFDTLTGRRSEFSPAQADRVRIYVCGVTPYAETHIGHARPSVFWDVVRRYLEYRGYRVFLVQNFTDVDDKVIAKAQEAGRDALSISRVFSDEYLELMERLGVRRADVNPRVSDHIEDIVEVVRGLVERGSAYESEGNVWFGVASFPGYGRLSRRSPEDVKAGARVEVDVTKRHPSDFALWKRAKPGEPSWPSPWGPGRPGWHIECSAMALKYLGSGFDFHGGGTDLIFPHHENEIAQSEAYTGQVFCRNWLHNEMLNLRGEKMSKSLGNTVTLREVLDRFPGGAVRLLLLGAHYRKALDFDFELLEENRRAWRRLNEAASRLRAGRPEAPAGAAAVPTASAAPNGLAAAAAEARQKFEAAMDDDFNTAGAVAALFDLIRQVNTAVAGRAAGGVVAPSPDEGIAGATEALRVLDELGRGVLGVVEAAGAAGAAAASSADAEALLGLLVQVRRRLRAERQFTLSDFVRDALQDLGYELQDGPQGTAARKKS
jgi:cysteinyl-tRNA synthetase